MGRLSMLAPRSGWHFEPIVLYGVIGYEQTDPKL